MKFLSAALFALFMLVVCGQADWRPDKLSECHLHPTLLELIRNDTGVWGEKGITEDLVRSLHDPCPSSEVKNHACTKSQRILIKNGTVYLTNIQPVNGWNVGHMLPGFLLELYETSQVYRLPDVEFAYWQDDNAPAETVKKRDGTTTWPFPPHGLPPIMAWAKNKMHGSLLVPYSSAFRCPRDSFDAIMGEVQKMSETPWEQRSSIAFGRWNIFCAWYYRGHLKLEDGTSAPCPRNYYNDLYYKHSDKLLTVALLRNLTNGTTATSVSLHEQHKYKYLVSTDGAHNPGCSGLAGYSCAEPGREMQVGIQRAVMCPLYHVYHVRTGWAVSSKFDKYMLLGSLLLKAEGLTYGFYYPAIKPFEHYVPIMKKHKDDILDMLEWAKNHDAEARRIAQNAQAFAMRHLNRQSRLCYMFHLISHLSKQMRYEVDCSRRPACIPLVEEIKFLSKFDPTSNRCRYQEVIAQYAHDDPDGLPGYSGYEELLRKHEAQPKYILFG